MKFPFPNAFFVLVHLLGGAVNADAGQLADCNRYRAAIDSQSENVTLHVSGGRPVAYETDGGYVARNVRLVGAIINIDKAKFRVRTVGPTSFSGDWQLFDYKKEGVVFTCRK